MRPRGPARALALLALALGASAGQAAWGVPEVEPARLWATDLGPGAEPFVAANALGEAFVAATVRGATTVWKLDPMGEVAWEARVEGLAAGIAALPGGGAVVATTAWGDGPDVRVAWLDGAGLQGPVRTLATPSARGGVADLARGVAASAQAVFVAGSAGPDLLAARFDLDGAPRWTRWLSVQREAAAEAIAVAHDGLPVLAGWSYDGTRNNLTLVKFDERGQLHPHGWVRQLAGPLGASLRAHAVGASPAGFLVVAGVQDEGARVLPFAAGLDAQGQVRWQRALAREPKAMLRAAAADAAGGALVAGHAAEPGGTDAWLARFAPDGGLAWSLRRDAGPHDAFHGLAWHPAGWLTAAGASGDALVAARYLDAPLRP